MVFSDIVFFDYSADLIDSDIQRLLRTGAYQPTYTGLVRAFLAPEIRHFHHCFGNPENRVLCVDYIGSVCDSKGHPDSKKMDDFLRQNDILDRSEQRLFKETTVREAFGSGFIRNYQSSDGKDRLVYFYDMAGNPFDSVYTFCHELTHALQDRNNYNIYGLDKKGMSDYREIHANLTAATFMMVKAFQTGQDGVVRQTTENLERLSAKMAHVMKSPKLGIRYFDWKGLKSMLKDIPDQYQNLLDKSGNIDWNRLYDYTEQKVRQMEYTPLKVQSAKKLLSEKIAPVWDRERESGNNRTFFEKIQKHQGQNEIVDDFLDAFSHTLQNQDNLKQFETFYQQLGNPFRRKERLFAASSDGVPNISLYRKLYSDDVTKPVFEFMSKERLSNSER